MIDVHDSYSFIALPDRQKDASKDILSGRLILQPFLNVIESEVEAAAVGDNAPRLYIAEHIASTVVCADGSA